jgi:hypothetical protein
VFFKTSSERFAQIESRRRQSLDQCRRERTGQDVDIGLLRLNYRWAAGDREVLIEDQSQGSKPRPGPGLFYIERAVHRFISR